MKDLLPAACRSILAFAAGALLAPAWAQKLPQDFTLDLPPSAMATAVLSLPAAASSGLPVSYAWVNNGICDVGSGPQLFLRKPGTCTVTASNPGDDQYEAFSVTSSTTVTWDVTVHLPTLVRLGDVATADFGFDFATPVSGNVLCTADWGTHAPGGISVAGGVVAGNHVICTVTHGYTAAGFYTVNGVMGCTIGSVSQWVQLIVFDPAGRLAGLGAFESPPGAFLRNPPLTGTFTFQVSASYDPGATYPTGAVAFELTGGSIPINFHSTWLYTLVVSGTNATLMGAGVDHNNESFYFELSFTQGPPDRIRVTAWDLNGNAVYDTQGGVGLGPAPTTPLSSGGISVSH